MKKMDTINICIVINSSFVRYAYVMLLSLYQSNKDEDINLFVLNRDLTKEDCALLKEITLKYKKKIHFVDINKKILDRISGLYLSNGYSIEVYFRLLILELIPEDVDRILSLDTDLIIRKSLSGLYSTNFDGNYMAVCKDMMLPELDAERIKLFGVREDKRYFNAGVVLWNLKEIREKYKTEDFIGIARKYGSEFKLQEQDVLNYMMYGKVRYLDETKYNYQIRSYLKYGTEGAYDAVVLHYTNYHPWQVGEWNELYKIWWDYARQTPYYDELAIGQLERLGGAWEMRLQLNIIYEKMFELRNSNLLFEYINNITDKIVIYGLGKVGKDFIAFLEDKEIDLSNIICMDRTTIAYKDFRIYNDFLWSDREKSYLLIVTPSNGALSIIRSLRNTAPSNFNIMHLSEFLEQALDF